MFVDRHARHRWLATRAPVGIALVGAISLIFAVPAFGESAAEIEARTAPAVVGTPCTAAAKACVDVNKKQAWLIKDGKVMRGPVPISTGGTGKDTPTGNVFRVYRKDADFKSDEFKMKNGQPAPMPNAVFFEDGGIAFHAGNPRLASAGCVHLNPADAAAWFGYLQIGDHVQVMDGPVAAKPLTPEQIAAANGDGSSDDSDSDSDDSDSKDKKDSEDKDSDSKDSDSKDSDSKDSAAKKAEAKKKEQAKKAAAKKDKKDSDSDD